jgi:hypothetical protein
MNRRNDGDIRTYSDRLTDRDPTSTVDEAGLAYPTIITDYKSIPKVALKYRAMAHIHPIAKLDVFRMKREHAALKYNVRADPTEFGHRERSVAMRLRHPRFELHRLAHVLR